MIRRPPRSTQFHVHSFPTRRSSDLKDFPYEAFTGKKIPVNGSSVNVKFTGLAPGEYAIVVHHDENCNDKVDKNILGLPLEGYCFSNNVKALTAPPKFKSAKFTLDTAFSQTLKMINL